MGKEERGVESGAKRSERRVKKEKGKEKKQKKCQYCKNIIDFYDIALCNTCIDNTKGRNQHFFQIKYEEN